jgi:Na+/citrate or Na+/malate symporter
MYYYKNESEVIILENESLNIKSANSIAEPILEIPKKGITFYGIPPKLFLPMAIPVILSGFLWDNVPVQLIGAIAILFTFGIMLGEIGEKLPLWNKYLGGGATFCLLAMTILSGNNLLPKTMVENVDGFMSNYNFLTLFVSVIVVGSILGIERTQIVKSLGLYIPAIISCIIGAALFGIVSGLIFGITPITILTSYVFPMLGGGIAAGAIPMSQIYGEITGNDPTAFLSHSVSVITMGNLIAILLAVVYDFIGTKLPSLTSNGILMKSSHENIAEESDQDQLDLTPTNIVASFFVVASLFMTAHILSTKLLPTVMGVPIHTFGYLIILVALVNFLGVLPDPLRFGCMKLQSVFGGRLGWIMMTGVGMSLVDVENLVSVLNVETITIVFSIVLGGSIFAGFFGHFVGFYFIESAMTAGLCMTDMGGAGDLAILGAANRLSLMSYSSVSTRIGAAIILLLASIGFTFL